MIRRVARSWGPFLLLAGILVAGPGCGDEGDRPGAPQAAAKKAREERPIKGEQILVGPNIYLEVLPKSRRVLVSSRVCLREGVLEGLLTRKGTKEHEYILAADIDARQLHTALTLAGATPGSPVEFDPYKPASGTRIKVSLRHDKGSETVTTPARAWIHDANKKEMDKEWVFAGSKLVPNEDPNKPPRYIANYGDIICTRNMEGAVIDLSIPQFTRLEDNRTYQTWTERIPELNTVVVVILEPVLPAKKR